MAHRVVAISSKNKENGTEHTAKDDQICNLLKKAFKKTEQSIQPDATKLRKYVSTSLVPGATNKKRVLQIDNLQFSHNRTIHLKITISQDTLACRLYDRDNGGEGTALNIVNKMREEMQTPNTNFDITDITHGCTEQESRQQSKWNNRAS